MQRAFAAGMLLASLTPAPPRIHHVFIIVLENQAYRVAFGHRSMRRTDRCRKIRPPAAVSRRYLISRANRVVLDPAVDESAQ